MEFYIGDALINIVYTTSDDLVNAPTPININLSVRNILLWDLFLVSYTK